MKTTLPFAQTAICIVSVFFMTLSATAQSTKEGSSSNLSNGLKFENYQLVGGADLQVGAEYRFSQVNDTTDAIVKIDSLVNGAQVNKIDDNSNGTGYKAAFQPAVQNGNIIGLSYAVFSVRFYKKGTSTPVSLQLVNATALDLDGNSNLKEYARIRIGNGGSLSYMSTTIDISVKQMNSMDFEGQNVLGVERTGIDTASYNNMFTATNSNISGFSISYGAVTNNANSAVRQYSLYLKGFYYPGSTLPVKLSAFSASLDKNKVNLKWETAAEINLSHFELERSTDGVNFTEAALVFAYGTATEKASYSFTDNVAGFKQPVVYYRLRSVDADGKNEVSETRIIKLSAVQNTISLQTYPNPVASELRVTLPAAWQNKPTSIEIFNANGQVALRQLTGGSNQTEAINVSKLAHGFYIVRAVCDGQVAQQKMIKQ